MQHKNRKIPDAPAEDQYPLRMCVICRERYPKPVLMRYTRNPDGKLSYDADQTSPGRGWYLCPHEACQKKFAKYSPSKRHMGGKQ